MKQYNTKLIHKLEEYAKSRTLEFNQYSPYHMRLSDSGYVCIDIWTTGKYYVKQTDYYLVANKPITERGGEKGNIPGGKRTYRFLDKLFFAADMLEETDEL